MVRIQTRLEVTAVGVDFEGWLVVDLFSTKNGSGKSGAILINASKRSG
jgi:hypothetical protein